MRTPTWCVAVALLSVGVPAMAQNVLSESDALARLSTDSPRVRAIRATTELARADVLAARRWPNPRATFNRESVSDVTENMWTVTQPLPISGRRGFEISAAQALADASASRAEDEIRLARAELRTAYAALVSAQAREATLGAATDRLRQLAGVLERREAAGDAAGYDYLRASREVVDLEADLLAARAERARAQGEVAAFFADTADPTTLVAVAAGNGRTPLPTVDELTARAASVLGEPAALRREMEAARFSDQAAGRRQMPEPEVVAGTKSSSLGGGDLGSVISVHVTVPLFDRGTAERAMARARFTQAEARSLAFRSALRARVSAARALVVERRQAADRYRATTGDGIERLERIAQVSYEAGERGILELLDAYRSGAATRTRQAVLDAAVRQAEIELEFVSGWEIQ